MLTYVQYLKDVMMKQLKQMKIEILVQLKITRNTEVTDKNLIKSMDGDLYIVTVKMEKKIEETNKLKI